MSLPTPQFSTGDYSSGPTTTAESQPLLECISRIRQITGTQHVMLADLPEAIKKRVSELEGESEIARLNEIVRARNATLKNIADACGLPRGTPYNAMPEAIRQRMTARPSKELIHEMVTWKPATPLIEWRNGHGPANKPTPPPPPPPKRVQQCGRGL